MAKIYLLEDLMLATKRSKPFFNSANTALLQSLYSRSSKSVVDHLLELVKNEEDQKDLLKLKEDPFYFVKRRENIGKTERAENFLKKYYIGYGHESIGELARTVVFFEDVSGIIPGIFQKDPLYKGTEWSTRFIKDIESLSYESFQNDLATFGGIEEIEYFKRVFEIFFEVSHFLEKTLSDYIPKFKIYELSRFFLPYGYPTRFSFDTDFRTLKRLIPIFKSQTLLPELKKLTEDLTTKLKGYYPELFGNEETLEENLANFKILSASNIVLTHDEPEFFFSKEKNLVSIFDPIELNFNFEEKDLNRFSETLLKELKSNQFRLNPYNDFEAYPLLPTHGSFHLTLASLRELRRHRKLNIRQIGYPPYIIIDHKKDRFTLHWKSYEYILLSIQSILKERDIKFIAAKILKYAEDQDKVFSENYRKKQFELLCFYQEENAFGYLVGRKKDLDATRKLLYMMPLGSVVRASFGSNFYDVYRMFKTRGSSETSPFFIFDTMKLAFSMFTQLLSFDIQIEEKKKDNRVEIDLDEIIRSIDVLKELTTPLKRYSPFIFRFLDIFSDKVSTEKLKPFREPKKAHMGKVFLSKDEITQLFVSSIEECYSQGVKGLIEEDLLNYFRKTKRSDIKKLES